MRNGRNLTRQVLAVCCGISLCFWRLCCKKSPSNAMGVTLFMFPLSSYSKQAGNERDLPHDDPLFSPL